ncbi:MAG: hypothetical protein CMF74_11275 [Maricaulis sp.]|nr:hypothetical protein [Maricaulis sp.]HAQ36741.1 DUF3108 domain-containing protein [Alphaproteobacteria bacterium]
MRRLTLALAALSLTLGAAGASADDAATAPARAEPIRISAEYTGSVLIFQVASIQVSSEIGDENYSANARFRAAGLAALFSDADIEAGVSGYNEGAHLQPWQYRHRNHASSKNRVIEINFPDRVAEPNITPPFGSMGEPPASAAQRAGAIDPLTGMMSLALNFRSNGGEPCTGRIPVFDGKARYNLRLERGGLDTVRNRGYRGEAIVCNGYYEPIAGYDPEDQPSAEDIAEPVTLWLAPFADGAVYFPVRIRANAGFGGITVEARSISVE